MRFALTVDYALVKEWPTMKEEEELAFVEVGAELNDYEMVNLPLERTCTNWAISLEAMRCRRAAWSSHTKSSILFAGSAGHLGIELQTSPGVNHCTYNLTSVLKNITDEHFGAHPCETQQKHNYLGERLAKCMFFFWESRARAFWDGSCVFLCLSQCVA